MSSEQQRIDSSGRKKEVPKNEQSPATAPCAKGEVTDQVWCLQPLVCPRPPWVKFVRLWNKKKNRQTENKFSFNTEIWESSGAQDAPEFSAEPCKRLAAMAPSTRIKTHNWNQWMPSLEFWFIINYVYNQNCPCHSVETLHCRKPVNGVGGARA